MKKYIFILALCAPILSFGQNIKFHVPCSNSEQAERDFKKGIRKQYIFGIAPDYTYCALLRKEGIEPVIQGCVVTAELECYNTVMQQKIEQEKGFGYFSKLKSANK